MKILIIDDHPIVIDALAGLIQDSFREATIVKNSQKKLVLDVLRAQGPFNFFICDLNFSGKIEGYEVIREARHIQKDLKVIVLSMHSELPIISEALRSGADAYVIKSDPPLEIFKAIEVCSQNKKFLSISCPSLNVLENNPTQHLSSREMQIAKLVAKGLKSKAIAYELKISERTVEVHRRNILRKLNVQNVAQMVSALGPLTA